MFLTFYIGFLIDLMKILYKGNLIYRIFIEHLAKDGLCKADWGYFENKIWKRLFYIFKTHPRIFLLLTASRNENAASFEFRPSWISAILDCLHHTIPP
jgi:hypothetical protein